MGKKLSIITINYNNAVGLRRTAESICLSNQKNFNIEWIIVDGGSSDDSLGVIKEYKQYIDFWISEKDDGIFDAMNKGLSKVIGEYVIFMNSGDSFVEGLLSPSFIKEIDGDIFYGDIYSLSNNKITYQKQTSYPDFIYMLSRTLCHQSVFMRTVLCKKYPFSTNFTLMGDWIQLFMILKKENPKVLYKAIPICIYDEGGVSNHQADLRKYQRMIFLQENYSSWELQGLSPIIRLRGRKYYLWVVQTLDSWKKQLLIKYISKIC